MSFSTIPKVPLGSSDFRPKITSSTPLVALDAVVLDTETTDLDARKARLIQIGMVRLRGGALDTERPFETLVNPGGAIPPPATAVHGITDPMVASAPRFAEVAESFETFVGDSIVIGHAINYDLTVLQREYELAGRPWRKIRAVDVRSLARLSASALADDSLDGLCHWFGIATAGRHTALGDAIAAAKVFLALVPLVRDNNIRSLAEAEAASLKLSEHEVLNSASLPSIADAPIRESASFLRVDTFPYRHLVRDVMSKPAVFAPQDATVRSVARLMVDKRISSVFVRTASGDTGICTERDILRAVDALGDSALSTNVQAIMNQPLQTVPDDAFVYRAVGRMNRLGFRHLGVVDGAGEIVGAVTTSNLLRDAVTSAAALGDQIDAASTTAELALAWASVPTIARNLLLEDVDPRIVSGVVSSEIRSMTRRAAELAEEYLRQEGSGPPPVPYAVLVLGSAGRGESQLAADQDNAIVYAEGREGGPEDLYFEKLATRMNDVLHAGGIPYCKGGVMARNRFWRKAEADWFATIDDWVRRQRPEDLLNVDIFFDAVPVHGEMPLGEAVWKHAYDRGHAARDFQNLMVEVARNRASTFNWLGGFRLDSEKRTDLKRTGLMPIFAAARVLSIRHQIRARSTVDRLNGFVAANPDFVDIVEATLDAYRVILGSIISQQLTDTESGTPASTRVATGRLDRRAKSRLKQALGAVAEAVDLVSEGRI